MSGSRREPYFSENQYSKFNPEHTKIVSNTDFVVQARWRLEHPNPKLCSHAADHAKSESNGSLNFVEVSSLTMIFSVDTNSIPFLKSYPVNSTYNMASVAAGQSQISGANRGKGTTRLDLLNSPSASVADSDGRLVFRRLFRRRFAPVSALRAGNAL